MGLLLQPFLLKCLIFLILPYFLTQCVTSVRQPCLDSERSALLQLKERFILKRSASSYTSAYPKVDSWKLDGPAGGDCCSWDGVECNGNTGRVIGLDLSSSFLYGSIDYNSSLFRLHHLRRLNLSDNDFNGSEIPSAIGRLSRLSHLDLSFSFFSGQIPNQVLELSKLVILDLSGNDDLQLRNPSLKSLSERLVNLKYLDLDGVNASSMVPQSLANLSSLTYLSLRSCELHGEFPNEVFQLPNLQILHASFNTFLTGRLPKFNKNSSLEELRLASTGFSGELPESIGNLKSLSHLSVGNCSFSGKIPTSLANLTELTYLLLSENQFSPNTLSWIAKLSRLVVLDVSSTNSYGDIPSSLKNLTKLTALLLTHNQFSNRIPYWLGNLTKLTYLSLAENEFSPTTLSWLDKLTKLTHLDVASTNSYGDVLPCLKNITRLIDLRLSINQFSSQIPSWLGNLTQMTNLDLALNQFWGLVPESIFTLIKLESLALAHNLLTGTYKLESFLNLKNLQRLQLSGNKFSLATTDVMDATVPKFTILTLGSCNLLEFPIFLSGQDKLAYLHLSGNKIHGFIPKWIWGLSAQTLEVLDLRGNFLTGFHQPAVVPPWTNLRALYLSSNKLRGSLPIPPASIYQYSVSNNLLKGEISSMICDLPSISVLDISNNSFSGMLPPCLGNLSKSLSVLNLQSNNFRGPIPPVCEKGSQLREIDLGQNELNGQIPRSLVNCSMLEFLNLGNNQIEDTFPSWLGRLPELKVVILRHNGFHGAIGKPKSNEFPRLRIFDLSFNRFVGYLPSHHFQRWKAMKVVDLGKLNYLQANVGFRAQITSWKTDFPYSMTMSKAGVVTKYEKIQDVLVAIDLSSNRFEGGIPEDIQILKAVQFLNLSNNLLSGPIPSSMANLTQLEALDLSQNQLSGEIPQELTQLNFLGYFDVSGNQLTGPIPQGKQFDTFENKSFEGNPGLCGIPLSKKCYPEGPSPPSASLSQREDGGDSWFEFGWKAILLGFGSGVVNGLVLGYLFNPIKHKWFVKYFGRMLHNPRRGRRN
ncbi:hypothetical protein V6N11_060002 [Hibiscus sabdariffa]|uniref:Leucine-rich repeat-containing N-terminal plant-type domain-containing protein n=1 Tax=Hibiscus sabdariffa TaxID=183260 RepID=A0ABR2NYQ3_9ROSI